MATKLLQNGIDRIYTNYQEITPDNILDVLAEVMPSFNKKSRFQKQLLKIVKGDTCITDGIRNANEKTRINQIKQLIFLTTAIMFNKELSLVPYSTKDENGNEIVKYKDDVELLVNLLRAENAHKKDMDLNIYAQSTGEAFLYTFSIDKPAFGNVEPKYFKIGVFEPQDTCAVYSRYLENGDEIILTIHKSDIKTIDENKVEHSIARYVCWDNTYKYIIDNEAGKYTLLNGTKDNPNPRRHELPFNPIGYIQNDIFRQSLTEDLIGLQDTLNLALSNFNNDILIKVNQILLLIGLEKLTPEQVKQLKDEGILSMTKDGDAKFIGSTIMIKELVDALVIMRNFMYELSNTPTQTSNRAETGKAVEAQNGHTLANFNSNMREYNYFEAKRNQLDNIIEILRVKKVITSDINANKIDIKFDQNRLTDFTQALDNFIKQINNGVSPYIAANNSKCFDNPRSVADSVVESREKQMQQTQQTRTQTQTTPQVNNNQEVTDNAE